jgi:hypothetical protein
MKTISCIAEIAEQLAYMEEHKFIPRVIFIKTKYLKKLKKETANYAYNKFGIINTIFSMDLVEIRPYEEVQYRMYDNDFLIR